MQTITSQFQNDTQTRAPCALSAIDSTLSRVDSELPTAQSRPHMAVRASRPRPGKPTHTAFFWRRLDWEVLRRWPSCSRCSSPLHFILVSGCGAGMSSGMTTPRRRSSRIRVERHPASMSGGVGVLRAGSGADSWTRVDLPGEGTDDDTLSDVATDDDDEEEPVPKRMKTPSKKKGSVTPSSVRSQSRSKSMRNTPSRRNVRPVQPDEFISEDTDEDDGQLKLIGMAWSISRWRNLSEIARRRTAGQHVKGSVYERSGGVLESAV